MAKKRQFLYHDLQSLRYLVPWQKWTSVRLRYFDDKNKLRSRRFKVWIGFTGIQINETSRSGDREAKSPKGPMTFRLATHIDTKYAWFGLVRLKVWKLPYLI